MGFHITYVHLKHFFSRSNLLGTFSVVPFEALYRPLRGGGEPEADARV